MLVQNRSASHKVLDELVFISPDRQDKGYSLTALQWNFIAKVHSEPGKQH